MTNRLQALIGYLLTIAGIATPILTQASKTLQAVSALVTLLGAAHLHSLPSGGIIGALKARLGSAAVKASSAASTTLLTAFVLVGCSGSLPPVQNVLTAEQTACQDLVLLSSVIPVGTDPKVVAADIQLACGIAESVTPFLVQVVAAFEAGQADAGSAPPAAAGPYKPSLMVLAKRGGK